jgi:predicted transcriptional regulator
MLCAIWAMEVPEYTRKSHEALEIKLQDAKSKGNVALDEVLQEVAQKFDGDKKTVSDFIF